MTTELSTLPAGLRAQDRATRTLSKAMQNRSCHAFMLTGSPGTGTREAALWIAQSVLCPNGGGDGCEVCGRIERGVHPDAIRVVADGVELRAPSLDRLIEQLTRAPFEAKAQVAIIEDAETLSSRNVAAANRLLKMLEEPTGDVVFVLVARDAAQVLPTIRSRVIEVSFRPLGDERMLGFLTEELAGQPPAAGLTLHDVVRLSRGDMQRAVDLARGGATLERFDRVLAAVVGLAGGSREPAEVADEFAEQIAAVRDAEQEAGERELEQVLEQLPPSDRAKARGGRDPEGAEARIKRRSRRAMTDELRAILFDIATVYRDLAALQVGAEDVVHAGSRVERLRPLVGTAAAANAIAAVDAVSDALDRSAVNVDERLSLASLTSELAGLGAGRVRSRRMVSGVPFAL